MRWEKETDSRAATKARLATLRSRLLASKARRMEEPGLFSCSTPAGSSFGLYQPCRVIHAIRTTLTPTQRITSATKAIPRAADKRVTRASRRSWGRTSNALFQHRRAMSATQVRWSHPETPSPPGSLSLGLLDLAQALLAPHRPGFARWRPTSTSPGPAGRHERDDALPANGICRGPTSSRSPIPAAWRSRRCFPPTGAPSRR